MCKIKQHNLNYSITLHEDLNNPSNEEIHKPCSGPLPCRLLESDALHNINIIYRKLYSIKFMYLIFYKYIILMQTAYFT
jgi:hypothetical protein